MVGVVEDEAFGIGCLCVAVEFTACPTPLMYLMIGITGKTIQSGRDAPVSKPSEALNNIVQ